jgi:hypothetical protein
MKHFVLPLLLLTSAHAYAETITIDKLYGCDTVDAQKLKLRFLRVVTDCASGGCKPGAADVSYANYQYIQKNHCRPIPSGEYTVLAQARVPGGRVVRIKSEGQLLWVLD